MRQPTLKLLSVPPWFDETTALDIIALGGYEESPSDQLFRARTSGLLIRRAEIERVDEPLRTKWREELFSDDESLYRRALRLFGMHARDGLHPKLEAVLGVHGAFLTVRALECVADDAAAETVSELISGLEGNAEEYDSARALVVANLIQTYGFKRSRLSDFFEGLGLWSAGRRQEAVPLFERVAADTTVDRPAAISLHLLGVVMYGNNQLLEAEQMHTHAITILRRIYDRSGLSLTLSSLGRTQRELYRQTGDRLRLERSIAVLREAVDLSEPYPSRKARALQSLAQALADGGENETAIACARAAVELASEGIDAVQALAVLATTYRAADEMELYVLTISRAAAAAEAGGVAGLPLARLLNMGAAAARRSGSLSEAEALARRSLDLGRQLNNERHCAHAAHTLASVIVDGLMGGQVADQAIGEAKELLAESRVTLAFYGDVDGINKIEATSARLTAFLRA